jgi:hypothetical protein
MNPRRKAGVLFLYIYVMYNNKATRICSQVTMFAFGFLRCSFTGNHRETYNGKR